MPTFISFSLRAFYDSIKRSPQASTTVRSLFDLRGPSIQNSTTFSLCSVEAVRAVERGKLCPYFYNHPFLEIYSCSFIESLPAGMDSQRSFQAVFVPPYHPARQEQGVA